MAIKTKGTQLYFVRPGTLDVVSVGCITAIENVGAPIQPRDVTPVESEWESSEPGIFSLGQIDLEIRFDPSTSGHIDVLDMYEGRQTANFAIGLGDGASPPQIDDDGEFVGVGGRSFLAFRGWIMDVPFSFPLNENLPATVSIMQVPSLVPGVLGVGLLPAEAGIPCASDSEYDGGEAFPSEVSVVLGSGVGWVAIEYLTGTIPDKFEVWLGGQLVFDSGYVGDVTWQDDLNAALANRGLPPEVIRQRVGTGLNLDNWPDPAELERGYFYKGTADAVATVRVYAPLPGTGWVFRLGCPDPHEYVVLTDVGAGEWTPPEGVASVDVLLVAGGGGGLGTLPGNFAPGGGGGAGGVIAHFNVDVSGGAPIDLFVGDGGLGGDTQGGAASGGQDSHFGELVAVGGGRAGGSGGSGGGGSPGGAVGSGTPGQGHDGAPGYGSPSFSGGGGGGAGGPGHPASPSGGGDGGIGIALTDLGFVGAVGAGAPQSVGGGGGGGAYTSTSSSRTGGKGGFGGGGKGGDISSASSPVEPGGDAQPGSGGGGGASSSNSGSSVADGGNGGSGLIVIRYLPADESGN